MACEKKFRQEIDELKSQIKRMQETERREKKKLAEEDAIRKISKMEEKISDLSKNLSATKQVVSPNPPTPTKFLGNTGFSMTGCQSVCLKIKCFQHDNSIIHCILTYIEGSSLICFIWHEEYLCRVRGQEVKGQGRISSLPFAHFSHCYSVPFYLECRHCTHVLPLTRGRPLLILRSNLEFEHWTFTWFPDNISITFWPIMILYTMFPMTSGGFYWF